ncbi:MAG: hypothetical protein K0S33_2554 [Bacteroidetes bacterium]|jgi:hypothetical protein|nr:hypothetical protein [Bacteroidota bacterium]
MKKVSVIVFLVLSLSAIAQDDDRFRLVLSAGAIGSQVDGDSYGGYTKLGPYGGLYLDKAIGEKTAFDFGITYAQKGARKNANNMDPTYYISRLHYVEMPFMFSANYKIKYRFEGGLSFAYLFDKHEESSQVGTINTPFKKFDFCYNLGFGYRFKEKLYVNLRYSYSFIPIRDYQAGVYLGTNFLTRFFNKGLYNNVLQLSLNYIISPKERLSE